MNFFTRVRDNIKLSFLRHRVQKNYNVKIFDFNRGDLNDAYKLRYRIYCIECKYLSQANYPKKMENDVYEQHSTHFLLYKSNSKDLIGYVRLVKPNSQGLPIEKDFGLKIEKSKNINEGLLEVSRLCIDPDYRYSASGNQGILLLLLKSVYKYSINNKYNLLYAAIDSNVYKKLNKFGFSFNVLGASKYYMGSESIPVLLNLNHESIWLKIVNPALWSFLNSN
ncbi:MAG: GNAT family N-acyltransferase [Patescibacteria group bacterium]|jgi:N-acyl-L-homoserine lactone synthetase